MTNEVFFFGAALIGNPSAVDHASSPDRKLRFAFYGSACACQAISTRSPPYFMRFLSTFRHNLRPCPSNITICAPNPSLLSVPRTPQSSRLTQTSKPRNRISGKLPKDSAPDFALCPAPSFCPTFPTAPLLIQEPARKTLTYEPRLCMYDYESALLRADDYSEFPTKFLLHRFSWVVPVPNDCAGLRSRQFRGTGLGNTSGRHIDKSISVR